MSNQSPFANFYDQVFATSSPDKQEDFLRQLFTIDARLCARYFNYINVTGIDHAIDHLVKLAKEESEKIKKAIIAYDWEDLYQTVPGSPDDYIEDVSKVLQEIFFKDILFNVEHNFRCGDLLTGLKNMRVIALSLDFDWEEKLVEPGSYYQSEIDAYDTIPEFNHLEFLFLDGIYSKQILSSAQDLLSYYITNPLTHFPHTDNWQALLELIEDRLLE